MANKSGLMSLPGGYDGAVTAAGSTIADATALTSGPTIVGTTASGTGVLLPPCAGPGMVVPLYNAGANTLKVYPAVAAGAINGGSAGAAVSIATTKGAIFYSTGSNTWIFVLGA